MKKIFSFLFLFLAILSLYQILNPSKAYAIVDVLNVDFHDNNPGTNWEAYYRIEYTYINSLGRKVADKTTPKYMWSDGPSFTYRWNNRDDFKLHWATSCIDPRVPFLVGFCDPVIGVCQYGRDENVTYKAGTDGDGLGGVQYNGNTSGPNDFGGTTCPADRLPNPPTGRSATTSCTSLTTSQINFEWNPIAHDSSYDLRYKRDTSSTWNTITGIGTGTGGDGKIHRIVGGLADNTLFDWQVRGHTSGNWNGPTNWSANENVRSANNNNCQPACTCGNWGNVSCGAGSCTANEMRQTRNCNPNGCAAEARCVPDNAGAWVDRACGGGSCASDQRHQTRNTTYSCLSESRCVADNSCRTRDLDITAFNFPGGDESLTSNATVTIRNIGNQSITNNFNVRVDNKINRTGQYQIWRVFQTVSPGQSIPHTFSNMPRPIPGDYIALATVDSGTEVSESNEDNNSARDPYTTWATPNNPIQGTVYVDSDGSGTISGGDGRYTKQGILTANPGGRTDQPSPTNGTYSIPNNPNGTYSVTLGNLATGYVGISTNPRTNVVVSSTPALGVNFLVRAPAVIPYTISGTIYIDSNGNRTIDGVDHLYTADEGAGAPIRVRARHNTTGTITDDTILTSSSMYSMDVVRANTGAYSLSVSNLVSGYSVVDGANAPYPRNINVAGNRSGENFLISATIPPATYSISGGVFIDNDSDGIRESTDGNGRKDAGEPYTNGTIRIGGTNYSSGGSGFSATGFADGSTQTVTYTSAPAGYNVTYPGSNPPSVGVTLGGACTDGGGDSSCNNGNVENLNFGIAPIITEPWIQSVGGDLRWDDANFINIVPDGATCSNTTRAYVSSNSVVNGNLSSGIVFTGTGPVFAQSGSQNSKASPNGWLLTGNPFSPARAGTIKTSYNYVKAAIDKGRVDTSPMFNGACSGGGGNCNLRGGLGHGAYIQTGIPTVTLRGGGTYSFPAGQDYVFLINGNLTIETNIDVPTDSTAIFIVSGNITVGSGVDRIEGIYSANGTFTFDGGTNNPLVIEGNIIANAGLSSGDIINNRDLEAGNTNCPAVRVVGRPDFILNSPELIRYPNSLIQEVAPQGGN